jgi:Zn-dependent M28 family amino/carboxypeptidase
MPLPRLAAWVVSLAVPLVAVAAPLTPADAASPDARLAAIAAAVDPQALHATIARLVGFGTRHTLSDTHSDTRGIGAARRWVKSRFEAISQDCGGCLQVSTPVQTVTGERVPQPTEVMDVVALQRGSAEPERVVLITGHLDSRVTDVMDATHDAPGANDDGSGVAAVLEAARVLSKQHFRATIVYGVLSGEEQGLYGGKLLAEVAKAQHWQVEAQLNNDIVGNSHGGDGVNDNATVRVFSEGTKATETPQQANRRRFHGGEVDAPARQIARLMATLAERHLTNLNVRMVYRTDRFGRGGDQLPFLDAGFPAVRVTEAHEDYSRQHQDLRTERGVHYGDTIDGVDFAYLAQVTRLDAITLAALAAAPAPPKGVAIAGAVTPDTIVKWQPVPGAAGYRVWWRDTTAPQWQHHRDVGTDITSLTLANISIDDWFFGVSAVGADGFASPVVFPGDAGAF